jgi:ABC-type cobalamin/Fe3+-siderophores transport system ATPase subunit
MTGNANAAKVIGIMGATGCGKSYFLRQCLGRPARKRTLIWSPKEAIDNYAGLYPGTVVCTTANAVLQTLKKAGAGPVHIVFKPTLNRKKDQALFGAVCKMAMVARNITVIAEEVHTVTQPSWAPDGWSELIMMGRGYGVEVFALSQRPASIDKDFFSNMSMLHVGRMNFDDDVKTCAKALRVPVADVANLTGFAYIERDILSGKTKKG